MQAGTPEFKNLPQRVIDGIRTVMDEAPEFFEVPSLPHTTSWPVMDATDTELLSQIRTERKRLKSSQDNHRRAGRLEMSHKYRKLLYGLGTWTNAWQELLVCSAVIKVDNELEDGLELLEMGSGKSRRQGNHSKTFP